MILLAVKECGSPRSELQVILVICNQIGGGISTRVKGINAGGSSWLVVPKFSNVWMCMCSPVREMVHQVGLITKQGLFNKNPGKLAEPIV